MTPSPPVRYLIRCLALGYLFVLHRARILGIELDEAAPDEEPEQQADGVDRDVDRRRVTTGDESLVELVARGV